ncbi:hypothetical protein CTI12_AA005460 [Artemisia annua]|uniref:Uncharacterized protein n=1 Tax=Artemisia annua TaxID=35608 RepID=A0A2U1PFT1_ARTAN|nr:hypothetical protein CTI12_AA005460 [Artemisia annua]
MSSGGFKNETECSTGQGKGGESDQSKQTEEITIIGADLTTELTSVLRSMIPMIVEETLKKLQEKRQVVQETTKRLKEEELQEWESRKMFFISRPPEYDGYNTTIYNWFSEMENAFERCECSDGHKVLYASFMLRGGVKGSNLTLEEEESNELGRNSVHDLAGVNF